MAYVTRDNITQRVQASFAECPSPRLKELMEKLVRHLHAFARDAKLTRDEWLFGIELLHRAGQISDNTRNEFMGLSDTLGLSSLVELMASPDDGRTPINLLGPFYVEDAQPLPFNADLKGDMPGQPTLLRGRVLDMNSRPIAGAAINLWQTQDDGLYDVQVPSLKKQRFRGWMHTEADGSYQVRTIKPLGYTAPMDGPIGEMLVATKRNEWRPAHWHFLIRAKGYQELITELYPSDSPHIDDDVAFGPRKELVVDMIRVDDPNEAKRLGIATPFHLAEFDFHLVPH